MTITLERDDWIPMLETHSHRGEDYASGEVVDSVEIGMDYGEVLA